MRPIAAAVVALLTASHAATAQGACDASDTTRARQQLTTIYGTFRAGFMRNVPQAWIDALTPTFTLTLFDGRVMPRAWVEEYVRGNATQFRIQTLAMHVRSLTRRADTVVAAVEQTSDRESTDGQGVHHRLEVGARQLETWVCTVAGWRLSAVKEDSLLYLRRDGRL
jgi:hypothetical protein